MKQLTEEERAATPSLVAFCATCKCVIACAVQRPEYAKDNAKHVASWVRDGLTVGTLRVSEVRAAKWCECGEPQQKNLPLKGIAT